MIRWLEEHEPESPIRVVAASERPMLYLALGERRWTVSAAVHWLPHLKRSVPHQIDECAWCEYPATVKSWIPVLQCPRPQGPDVMNRTRLTNLPPALLPGNGWCRKVLELPTSAAELLRHLRPGLLFCVCRGLGKFRQKVLFRVFDNDLSGWVEAPFDVRPFLIKAWGQSDGQNGMAVVSK